MEKRLNFLDGNHARALVGVALGTLVFGLFTIAALVSEYYLSGLGAAQLYTLVCVTGWCGGWFIGILYAPLSQQEAVLSERTYTVLAAFASGYLIGIVTPLIDYSLKVENLPSTFKGLLFFLSSFLTTLLMAVVLRRYGQEGAKRAAPTSE